MSPHEEMSPYLAKFNKVSLSEDSSKVGFRNQCLLDRNICVCVLVKLWNHFLEHFDLIINEWKESNKCLCIVCFVSISSFHTHPYYCLQMLEMFFSYISLLFTSAQDVLFIHTLAFPGNRQYHSFADTCLSIIIFPL